MNSDREYNVEIVHVTFSGNDPQVPYSDEGERVHLNLTGFSHRGLVENLMRLNKRKKYESLKER